MGRQTWVSQVDHFYFLSVWVVVLRKDCVECSCPTELPHAPTCGFGAHVFGLVCWKMETKKSLGMFLSKAKSGSAWQSHFWVWNLASCSRHEALGLRNRSKLGFEQHAFNATGEDHFLEPWNEIPLRNFCPDLFPSPAKVQSAMQGGADQQRCFCRILLLLDLQKHYSVKTVLVWTKKFFSASCLQLSLLLMYGAHYEGLRGWLKGRDKGEAWRGAQEWASRGGFNGVFKGFFISLSYLRHELSSLSPCPLLFVWFLFVLGFLFVCFFCVLFCFLVWFVWFFLLALWQLIGLCTGPTQFTFEVHRKDGWRVCIN